MSVSNRLLALYSSNELNQPIIVVLLCFVPERASDDSVFLQSVACMLSPHVTGH